MKSKFKLTGTLIFFIAFSFQFVFAQNNLTSFSERIKSFSAEITVNEDGSLLIEEKIIYDFGKNLKHGIYRDIPINNNAKIKLLKVLNERDNYYQYKVLKEGKYIRIKIGDPNKLIQGEHLYNIFYIFQGGIGFFNNHDELYWNVTGNNWELPVEKAEAIIHLPGQISKNNLSFACFTGFYGSKESECQWRENKQGNIIFETLKRLDKNEDLTIVVGWPKGIIREPFSFFPAWFRNFWPFSIPFLCLIFLLIKWWLKGKDPRIEKTMIAQYEPPAALKPAEMALIINQKVDPKDLSAVIVDLAVKGYLKIREIKKQGIFDRDDYELIKLKNFESEPKNLHQHEKELLLDIFEKEEKVLLSSLRNKFYHYLPDIIKTVYMDISNLNYFAFDPQKVSRRFKLIGWLIIFCGILLSIFIFQNTIFLLAIAVAGFLFLVFAPFMPKRTARGTEIYWEILGFKEYLNTAEKYRAQFYEKENIFEKYLPYAIIFRLVDKWATVFEGIYKTPPSWYEGDFGPTFSTSTFVKSLNRSLFNINNSFGGKSNRSSGLGGRGFSGGGSGGGGGGSW